MTTFQKSDVSSNTRHYWNWTIALAVVGVPILIWQTWTVVAWLTAGPHEVTEYRDPGSASWYAAKTFEASIIVLSIVMIVYLIRGCRRAHRFFTFEVMYCLCGATVFWADVGPNFFQPTFLYSSNFVNLTNPCGHMPFVVNPDCGRAPDAILFMFLFETFGLLAMAIVFGAIIRRVRERWPDLSLLKQFGVVMLCAFCLDAVLEPLLAIPLHLEGYPAPSWMSLNLAGGFRWPAIAPIAGAGWLGVMAALRIFKDDRGQSIVERGAQAIRPRFRKPVTLLAMYGFFQVAVWLIANVPLMAYGPYVNSWPNLPPHLVNGVCSSIVNGVCNHPKHGQSMSPHRVDQSAAGVLLHVL